MAVIRKSRSVSKNKTQGKVIKKKISKPKTKTTKSTPKRKTTRKTSKKSKTTKIKLTPRKKDVKKTKTQEKEVIDYSVDDHIVYPSHGVGKVISIEKQSIAEQLLKMYVVNFEKEKMILRVPIEKAKAIGIRRVSSKVKLKKNLEILSGKARIRRTMWSRRAQEYEAKINSGHLNELTEVVRDLFRNYANQPEQSYSERQLYEAARDRLAREVAVVENTNDEQAVEKIEFILSEATQKSSIKESIEE
jgi:CarD family transcriptional regulator